MKKLSLVFLILFISGCASWNETNSYSVIRINKARDEKRCIYTIKSSDGFVIAGDNILMDTCGKFNVDDVLEFAKKGK